MRELSRRVALNLTSPPRTKRFRKRFTDHLRSILYTCRGRREQQHEALPEWRPVRAGSNANTSMIPLVGKLVLPNYYAFMVCDYTFLLGTLHDLS